MGARTLRPKDHRRESMNAGTVFLGEQCLGQRMSGLSHLAGDDGRGETIRVGEDTGIVFVARRTSVLAIAVDRVLELFHVTDCASASAFPAPGARRHSSSLPPRLRRLARASLAA